MLFKLGWWIIINLIFLISAKRYLQPWKSLPPLKKKRLSLPVSPCPASPHRLSPSPKQRNLRNQLDKNLLSDFSKPFAGRAVSNPSQKRERRVWARADKSILVRETAAVQPRQLQQQLPAAKQAKKMPREKTRKKNETFLKVCINHKDQEATNTLLRKNAESVKQLDSL